MAEIPKQEFTVGDISEWFKLKQDLASLKVRETLARINVFKHCFEGVATTKQEGTNNFDLPENYVLKAVTSVTRTLSIETLRALAPDLKEIGVVADDLVRWKPEIDITAYRQLNDAQRKVFDQCLEIKPGTPQLDVVLPAKFKNKTGQELSAPSVSNGQQTPF